MGMGKIFREIFQRINSTLALVNLIEENQVMLKINTGIKVQFNLRQNRLGV